ncbi:protein SERAC1 [Euwallacea similis]|uniref:protein SERAC1 n=1 Tax=Euwallacea similis TaxID=1736056 RepID=UPI00345021B5
MSLTVEDIMGDQCILSSSECNFIAERDEQYLAESSRKLWLQNVLYTFTNHLVPALAAFLANSLSRSLAPLQRIPLNIPSGVVRIRLKRATRSQPAITESLAEASHIEQCLLEEEKSVNADPCVDCSVLYEPAEGEVAADVIFVHGLHGGLDRTWRQGTWRVNNPKLKDLTPVRRRSTDDFYVPIKQDQQLKEGRLKRTLTRIYTTVPKKIARTKDGKDEPDRRERIEEEMEYMEEPENVENFSGCWPKDWLPQDCPNVRVLAINYTTDVLWRPMWQKMKARTTLPERSNEMMEELLRLDVGCRPIVWVGHSKGGLYIKQIILNGWNADQEQSNIRHLFQQTKAIMFYSVPHKGSPIADMTFPFFRRSIEVLEVQTNCEFVLNLHRSFLEMLNKGDLWRPEIFSFIDTENTPVAFTSFKFIAYESADPDVGIKCDVPLDHREICKPAGRDCFLYLELVNLINRSIFGKSC